VSRHGFVEVKAPELRLSVVIPTRNRFNSLKRLLQSLAEQSLSTDMFEVIVVDDGSDEPVSEHLKADTIPFRTRVLYQRNGHGAHASRWTGLKAAVGARVLFLDDDIEAEYRTLEYHADENLREEIAVSPIHYPEKRKSTPYYRHMAHCYRIYTPEVDAKNPYLPPGIYWICGSSMRRDQCLSVFTAVEQRYQFPMVGGEFDESLIAGVLFERGLAARFIADALLWHHDDKTLLSALRDARLAGEATGRLLLSGRMPECFLTVISDAVLSRSWTGRVRKLYWKLPWPFLSVCRLIGLLAEYGPSAWVPRKLCGLAISVNRHEGMRSAIPCYKYFVSLLSMEAVPEAGHQPFA
jgi:glycosyltransferase involved in cell wall biosynthesis